MAKQILRSELWEWRIEEGYPAVGAHALGPQGDGIAVSAVDRLLPHAVLDLRAPPLFRREVEPVDEEKAI